MERDIFLSFEHEVFVSLHRFKDNTYVPFVFVFIFMSCIGLVPIDVYLSNRYFKVTWLSVMFLKVFC